MREAVVRPIRELRKWRRIRNLAAERRQKPKERTQGYCGSRKRVIVAGRRTFRHATVAWRKRNLARKIRIQGSLESLKEFATTRMMKGQGCSNDIGAKARNSNCVAAEG
jgi:hypothetical protein